MHACAVRPWSSPAEVLPKRSFFPITRSFAKGERFLALSHSSSMHFLSNQRIVFGDTVSDLCVFGREWGRKQFTRSQSEIGSRHRKHVYKNRNFARFCFAKDSLTGMPIKHVGVIRSSVRQETKYPKDPASPVKGRQPISSVCLQVVRRWC